MAPLRQRAPRIRDAKHLAYVRLQPCCVCPKGARRPSEAAHIRMPCPARDKPSTGMQQKPDDKWTVPLCSYHHRNGICAQHKMGEAAFWKMVGRDPFAIALGLWSASGGEARAASTTPRLIKPPSSKAKRFDRPKRKIRSRSQIHNRGFEKRPRHLKGIRA